MRKPSLAFFGNLVRGKIGSIVNSSVLEFNLVFLLPLAAIIQRSFFRKLLFLVGELWENMFWNDFATVMGEVRSKLIAK